MVRRLETRRIELQGSHHITLKLRKARSEFRNNTLVKNAYDLYDEHIVDELIKEGFIYKKDDKFILMNQVLDGI